MKEGTKVLEVGDITDLTAATTFNASKGAGGSDQSTWQKYHDADVIEGKLYLNPTTGQLYTDAGTGKAGTLNHRNADVVITIAVPTKDNPWATGEFENHIHHAKIEVHSTKTVDGKLIRYNPWLSEVTKDGATLRVHMEPGYVPASGKTIITITPADGSNPVTGTYKLDDGETFSSSGTDSYNQRLTISFADYKNQRTLTATAKVIPWADGGSEDLVHGGYDFVIRNEDDLKLFRAAVEKGGNDPSTRTSFNVIQVKDIDLSGENWEPIGRYEGWNSGYCLGPAFKGTYDGGGYTISGLTINRAESEANGNAWHRAVGLFGHVNEATLTNIHLKNVNIQGYDRTGALAGISVNSTITGCSVTGGSVTGKGDECTGSLVGQCFSYNKSLAGMKSIITKCYANNIAVIGENLTRKVGGLVGEAYSQSDISETTVAACYTGSGVSVTGKNTNTGGLVGSAHFKDIRDYYSATVAFCYSNATVAGVENTGGLVGNAGKVVSCYATGAVTGTGTNIGSLVGYLESGTVSNSYGGDSNLNMIDYPIKANEYTTAGEAVRSYDGEHAGITKSIWGPGDTPQLTWQ